MKILRRVWALLRGRSLQKDIEEEMRTHLEMSAADNSAAGMTEDEARRDARLRFGNPVAMREQVQAVDAVLALQSILADVRYGLRQLRRSPGFTIAAVLTLALGIGANVAIFSVVEAALLRALPYDHPERILKIRDVNLKGRSAAGLVSIPRFGDVQKQNNVFDMAAYFFFENPTLNVPGKDPVTAEGKGVSGGFWRVYGVPPLLGRLFDEKENAPNAPVVAVISYGFWQRAFGGDPKVAGMQVQLADKPATIVGVMPASFGSKTDLWRPAQLDLSWFTNTRGDSTRFVNVVALMRPGIKLSQAQANLDTIAARLQKQYAATDADWSFQAVSARDDLYGDLKPALLVLMAAAGLVLVIACVNIANLLLSRATVREREVALRRSLGASSVRIFRQFLTESLMLALSGSMLGVAAAWGLILIFAKKLPLQRGPLHFQINAPVLAFALGICLLTAIVFGLVPAAHALRGDLNQVLKRGENRGGAHGQGRIRNIFVAAQVCFSLVLLVGAGLLIETLWHLETQPLGFEPDHVLGFTVSLSWAQDPVKTQHFYNQFEQRLHDLPGVSATGQITRLPLVDFHSHNGWDIEGLPPTLHHDRVNAEMRSIHGGYLEAMRVPLLAGREFTAQEYEQNLQLNELLDFGKLKKKPVATPVLVNRKLVQQYFPQENPIGKRLIDTQGNANEVVGVIGDVRGTSGEFAADIRPEIYFPADGGWPEMTFVVRSQVSPETLLPAIREQLKELDPQKAISKPTTLDDLIDESVAQPRLNMALLVAFAVIALVLACVGMYGVISYSVAQRTREIGVRVALGATKHNISSLFLAQASRWSLGGLVLGVGLSLALARLMQNLLYGVRAYDLWTYLLAALLLACVALVAAWIPARRAAAIDPMKALRVE